ncbi:hypothetical protein LCGC14_1846040, partial [marine sediment metagenome]
MVSPILCVVGSSGSGKTTLLERVVASLSAGGLTVGTIKHAHHGFDAGTEGKDSDRFAAAGARPGIVLGPEGLLVQGAPAEPSLVDAVATFCRGCDLVLVEGCKESPHDKVLLPGEGKAIEGLSSVRLVVGAGGDLPDGLAPRGAIDRDDVEGVTDWIRQWLDRRRRLAAGVVGAIMVGGKSRRMGADKAAMQVQGQSVLARLAELLAGRVQ